MSVRHIVLRVTQDQWEEISKWKKPKESWESYVLSLVRLVAEEIYQEVKQEQ